MCKLIYQWLAEAKARNYSISIKSAIKTIEKYGSWDDPTDINKVLPNGSVSEITGNANFKRVSEDKEVYDLFYDNLHIHVSVSESEKIYSIRIKNPHDPWTCPFNAEKMMPDFSHPVNEHYEVYVWYLVPVLDITSAEGDMYKHGTWDKYVYKKMSDFFEKIRGETDTSKFNGYYK